MLPVDLFGQPARYEDILPIAREHGLFVLQDAAQSFGARWQGEPVGRQGDAAALSFYPSKPLGAYGDGGAVLTDDDALAQRVRSLARHGLEQGGLHVRIGANSRLDTIQAAILLAKLPALDQERAARAAIAGRYADGLAGSGRRAARARGYRACLVLLHGLERAARCAGAGSRGARHRERDLLPQAPAPGNPPTQAFPRAPRPAGRRSACRQGVSLPMHADLEPDDQARIIDAISSLVGEKGA